MGTESWIDLWDMALALLAVDILFSYFAIDSYASVDGGYKMAIDVMVGIVVTSLDLV